jgi:hypothetical protein
MVRVSLPVASTAVIDPVSPDPVAAEEPPQSSGWFGAVIGWIGAALSFVTGFWS